MLNENQCCQERLLEKYLIDIVYTAVQTQLSKMVELLEVQARLNGTIKVHEKKANALNEKIDRLKQAKVSGYIKLTKRQISEDEFQENKETINKAIADYEDQVKSFEVNSISGKDLSVVNLFQKYIGTESLNREMLLDLIKVIYVYDDKRIEIVWNFKDTMTVK